MTLRFTIFVVFDFLFFVFFFRVVRFEETWAELSHRIKLYFVLGSVQSVCIYVIDLSFVYFCARALPFLQSFWRDKDRPMRARIHFIRFNFFSAFLCKLRDWFECVSAFQWFFLCRQHVPIGFAENKQTKCCFWNEGEVNEKRPTPLLQTRMHFTWKLCQPGNWHSLRWRADKVRHRQRLCGKKMIRENNQSVCERAHASMWCWSFALTTLTTKESAAQSPSATHDSAIRRWISTRNVCKLVAWRWLCHWFASTLTNYLFVAQSKSKWEILDFKKNYNVLRFPARHRHPVNVDDALFFPIYRDFNVFLLAEDKVEWRALHVSTKSKRTTAQEPKARRCWKLYHSQCTLASIDSWHTDLQ